MNISEGYYTALGTPLDQNGCFLAESFSRQVDDQVKFGAAGLLVMGSMGLGVFIRDRDYTRIAQTAAKTVHGRCPVFVGVTDTSIGRTCDRIDALADLAIDGVVATAPHYYSASVQQQINFYSALAHHSPYPVYLYDLPIASRSKITLATMRGLAAEKNIKGIKTADMPMAEALQAMAASGEMPADFKVLYSGLDTFDHASLRGIDRHLDGMFACTGALAQKQYQALHKGDHVAAAKVLIKIIELRDIFAKEEIMPSFTCAMNLLGYEGSYAPDYYQPSSPAQCERVEKFMRANQLI